MTETEWLMERLAQSPVPLRTRLESAIEKLEPGSDLAGALLGAACAALDEVRDRLDRRDAALDLLVADGLLTLACEAAAFSSADALAERCRAMGPGGELGRLAARWVGGADEHTRSSRDASPVTPPGMADLHTHMIPGVDDGAPDLETALAALRSLFEDGVTAVAATPHLDASRPHGARRALADRAWPELVERARREVPGLKLHRGFEIQLDTPELDLSDEGLRLAGSRFVLVEFHYFTIPTHSADALEKIRTDGYVPILVHPERYWGYGKSYDVVPEWRSAGALLQLNGGSLLGENGERIRTTAHHFLGRGWADLIASDNHARPSRNLSLRRVWDYLVERGLEEQARLLLATNPHRILRDEMPLSVGRAEVEVGLLSRLSRALKGER